MRPEASCTVALVRRLSIDSIFQRQVQDLRVKDRLCGKHCGLLKVIVLAPCARRISADDRRNRHIYRAHIRDRVESILLTGVITQLAQRVRVIVEGHAGRDAKGRNPQQVLFPHMQRAGQDSLFVLENVPGAYSGFCQQALVLPRLRLCLQCQRHRRSNK